MYIPKNFELKDHAKALDFVKRFHFGTVVTTDNARKPIATHLPFVLEYQEEQKKPLLFSHLARANDQWRYFDNKEVLCIFQAPHAYISPEWYNREQSVPTWDYEAVHIYGKVSLINDEKGVIDVLEKSIDFFEQGYRKKWEKLDNSYKKKLFNGLVAFSVSINEIQAVQKLSQDRNSQEKETIVTHLSNSTAEHERMVAESMKKLR
jgi:transcriptional regulator